MYQYQKRITTASQGKYCHNCQQDFNLMGPKSFGRHLSQCISRPIPIHNTSLKNLIQKQHESETYQYQKRANKINSLFRRETIEETANKRRRGMRDDCDLEDDLSQSFDNFHDPHEEDSTCEQHGDDSHVNSISHTLIF